MKAEVKLYNVDTIDEVAWDHYHNGKISRNYLLPLIKEGTQCYFDNIHADVMLLSIRNYLLPLVINRESTFNSYVCSPSSLFIEYAAQEVASIGRPWIRKNLSFLINQLKKILKKGDVDKIVYVNNWLLATDLYPPLNARDIQTIVAVLKYRFPDHVIAFRSINGFKNRKWPSYFESQGCDLVPTRQVFYFDSSDENTVRSRMFKSDLKVLRDSHYQILEAHHVEDEKIPRLVELYRALYIDKHSTLNPQLNASFFRRMIQLGLMNLKVLKSNDQIDAVVGYYECDGEMTSPIFGYDTKLPQELGLYRQISTLINLEAVNKKFLLNQSSGAASYKRLRRAKGEIDYMAVYHRHLPLKRRIPWQILRSMMRQVGLRIIQRYDF